MTGVRTELVFPDASGCPVAAESADIPGPVRDVTWTEPTDGTVTEQVTAEGGEDIPSFEETFDYGSEQVYEFERAVEDPCICETIQGTVGPVADVYAQDGDLHVTLHARDVDQLRDLITDLRDRYGTVSVEYLVRSVDTDDGSEMTTVDLRRLTDRQREVLDVAREMGYFEYPRGANASEVAERLDIQPSTFAEHLAAAQQKLFDELTIE